MSKKTKTPITKDAVSRIHSAEAIKNGGKVSSNSFTARATRTLAKAPKTEGQSMEQHEVDNRADQLNPENDAYWQSRGEDERPDNWEEYLESD